MSGPPMRSEKVFVGERFGQRKPYWKRPEEGSNMKEAKQSRVRNTEERRMRMPTPKFPLGQVVATPGALEALGESGQTPTFFLDQHASGNWGVVDVEDWRVNDQSLKDG